MSDTSLDSLFGQRRRKADELRALGVNPYANDFRRDTHVDAFMAAYQNLDATALDRASRPHALAGRVVAINSFGKAAFLRMVDGSGAASSQDDSNAGKLQLYVRRDQVSEAAWTIFKKLDLGDFVGVCGRPMRTKTNELSLHVDDLRLLTKTLRPLPEKWHGLADVEKRYRQRYLDLIANPEVRATFVLRSRLLLWLRQFFVARGFLEVETPMMHSIAGGAAARPFKTHHNALGMDLYLRIAPELYLKRLVVGGFERVFEINRNFRNEGISTVHNPEFTMLEFYQAYADFRDMMQMVEELVCGAAAEVLGHAAPSVVWGGARIELKRPFAQLGMLEAIAAHGGPSPQQARDPAVAAPILQALHIQTANKSSGQLVLDLFEHFAEPNLVAPTFIYDFPADVSPLSRRQDHDPYFVDRFELYVGGRELANAFSELNDPVDQRERFLAQLQDQGATDDKPHTVDEDYVRALEHGMPPTAGCGVGVDRLIMLLTESASIRDVILFPVLRPEQ